MRVQAKEKEIDSLQSKYICHATISKKMSTLFKRGVTTAAALHKRIGQAKRGIHSHSSEECIS